MTTTTAPSPPKPSPTKKLSPSEQKKKDVEEVLLMAHTLTTWLLTRPSALRFRVLAKVKGAPEIIEKFLAALLIRGVVEKNRQILQLFLRGLLRNCDFQVQKYLESPRPLEVFKTEVWGEDPNVFGAYRNCYQITEYSWGLWEVFPILQINPERYSLSRSAFLCFKQTWTETKSRMVVTDPVLFNPAPNVCLGQIVSPVLTPEMKTLLNRKLAERAGEGPERQTRYLCSHSSSLDKDSPLPPMDLNPRCFHHELVGYANSRDSFPRSPTENFNQNTEETLLLESLGISLPLLGDIARLTSREPGVDETIERHISLQRTPIRLTVPDEDEDADQLFDDEDEDEE